MHRRTLIVALLVVAAVGAVVLVLATGSPAPEGEKEDRAGDVKIGEGPLPPRITDPADIREIDVRADGEVLTLEARMGTSLVRPVPEQSTTWRWEIYEDGDMTWIVSANVDLGPHVSVIATEGDFQASTNDKSLPGRVSVAGDTILVRLRISEIEGFPSTFETVLKTSLDGMRAESKSALATDRAPDGDLLQVGG
ncbi:MAG TPA: hypothetical protein VE174_08565 [Actinomycetota bacterium]|nr:hypothetical protein [Actinomycetota bacterium]